MESPGLMEQPVAGDQEQEVQPQSFNPKAQNLVTLPDGSRHLFPPGTTKEQMEKALGTYKPSQNKTDTPVANWWDKAVDTARSVVPVIGGVAGAAAGALVPGLGETGISELAGETQGYALTDALMKYLKTEKPKSMTEALTESEKDAAVNAVAGRLMQGVWRGGKALFSSDAVSNTIHQLMPTTSQALEAYGNKILAKGAQFLEDYGATSAKAAALDRAGGEGFTQSLAYAKQLNGRNVETNASPNKLFDKIRSGLMGGFDPDVPELGTTARDVANKSGTVSKLHAVSEEALNLLENKGVGNTELLDNVLDDTSGQKLAKVLKVGQVAGSPYMNVKKDLGAYQFMRMVEGAYTENPKMPGTGRIDPGKLTSIWNDSKMASNFDTLYGKEGKQRITDFFKDIAYTQGDPNAKIQTIGKGAFAFGAGTGLIKAIAGKDLSTLGAVTGLKIGAWGMGHLLTNPTTARVVSEMAKGSLTTATPEWAYQMIGQALKGYPLQMLGINGRSRKGTIVEDDNGDLKFEAQK